MNPAVLIMSFGNVSPVNIVESTSFVLPTLLTVLGS